MTHITTMTDAQADVLRRLNLRLPKPATAPTLYCSDCHDPLILGTDGAPAWHVCSDDYFESECPACGSVIDYCQGHGEIGDPAGFAILVLHDEGDHSECATEYC